MDMRFYLIKDRVKLFFCVLETRKSKHGGFFMKNHAPDRHSEICATYLYMANALLKTDQKIVQKWANDVLTPIHMFAVTPVHTVAIRQNRTVLQGCANVVRTYGHTNTKKVT